MSVKNMPGGVVALGFVSLFMDISSEMIHSILPLFLTTALAVSPLAVGIIEGIAESTAAIVKIFSGAVSDWISRRKPLLLAGYGLSTLTKPLFPIADSFMTVLVARFADRIGKGIRVAPRDAFIADLTPEHQRGAAYGLRQSMDTVGAFLGPALAMLLMLLTANSFRTVFALAIIPALIVMAIIIFRVKEPPQRHAAEKRPFPLQLSQMKLLPRPFWWITGFAAVLTLARFSEAFLILRGDSLALNAAYAPAILIVMNIFYAASSWPAGILSDRIGKTGLLAAGIGMLVVADLVLAFAGNVWLVFAGSALWGLHMGLTQGLLTAFVAAQAPGTLRGTAFGMYNLVTGIALLLASVAAGWLWKDFGPAATFMAGAGCSIAALAGFYLLQPRLKEQRA
jgi:MFS family permease